jgi:hypothetical protein
MTTAQRLARYRPAAAVTTTTTTESDGLPAAVAAAETGAITMTDNITKLEHTRVLKQIGWPLDTPVEERAFSLDYSRHWFALMDASDKFMAAVGEYAGSSPRAGSPRQMAVGAA